MPIALHHINDDNHMLIQHMTRINFTRVYSSAV